jgi:hypothetical protein
VAWCAWIALAAPSAFAKGVDDVDGAQILLSAAEQSAASGRPIEVGRVLKVGRSLRLAANIVFAEDGAIEAFKEAEVTLEGKVSAPSAAHIFRGEGSVKVTGAEWVSVAWWGAGTNQDAAPAFRQALGSNRTVHVPPGRYVLGSVVPAPCCAFNGPMIFGSSLQSVHFEAYGATLSVAEAQAYSTILHFDRSRKVSLAGGAYIGSRHGMKPDAENVALTFSSVVDLDVRDIEIAGNFGGNGAGVAGDWIVNAHFEDVRMERVGICFDIAFVQDMTINRLTAAGADHAGENGRGQAGMKCISNIYDTPNLHNNHSGVAFGNTERLTVSNSTIRNFTFGTSVTTGTDFLFSRNRFEGPSGVMSGFNAAHFVIAANTPAVQGYTVEGDLITMPEPNSHGVFISTAKNGGSTTNVIRGVSVTGTSFDTGRGYAIEADSQHSLGPVRFNRNQEEGAGVAVGPTIRPLITGE